MKKLLCALLLMVSLAVVFTLSVSAELYSPSYYGVQQVEAGAITVDGAVDEAYGAPIFYYVQDGTDEAGDYTNTANWFFTNSNSDDCLFLVENEGQYAKGYAVWQGDTLYLCVDTNIDGWQFENIVDGDNKGVGVMWQAYCLQVGIFDYDKGSNIDWGIGIDNEGKTHQYNFVSSNGARVPVGETQWEAAATRDFINVIYEVALPLDQILSKAPSAGSRIGMDICIDFCEISIGGAQNCLTFVNANYHARNINDARPLYFLDETVTSAADIHKNIMNEKEAAPDDHSISLLGCNDAFGSFTADTEDVQAGFASLSTSVGNGFVNATQLGPVDGSKYDTLEFELYISDPKLFDAAFADTGLELTSAGKEDNEEIAWKLANIKAGIEGGPKAGWNHVVLYFKDAGKTGEINLTAINFMRFFMVGAAEDVGVTLKIDNMRLTDAYAQILAEMQKDADKVAERIEKLEEVTADNYINMASKINSARKAYDKLDDAIKALIPADIVAKLETAEAKYEEIKNAAENPEPEPDVDEDDQEQEPHDDQQTGDDQQTTEDDTSVPEDVPEEKKGCGSVLHMGSLATMMLAAVAVALKRKKND